MPIANFGRNVRFTPSHYAVPESEAEVLQFLEKYRDASDSAYTDRLEEIGLLEELQECRGSETFHYPLFLRRVLPDDTLISMASGGDEPWYTISFFCYRKERSRYDRLIDITARCLIRLYGARLHWGKRIPIAGNELQSSYDQFRDLCRRVDPQGVFRNEFAREMLGF